MDPRISSDKSIVNEKSYKTNPAFTTIASSLEGGFALGSANGDIRLYK